MDSANSHLACHAPGVGFRVLHYWKPVSTPSAPLMVHCIGVFTSLDHAQDATRCEYQRVLTAYLNRGYYGRSFSKVDLDLRGLITAYVDVSVGTGHVVRRELPLSEFHISNVDVWDPSWGAEVHRTSLDSLFGVSDSHRQSRPVVLLPKPLAHNLPPECAPQHVQHQEELSPTWTRSRIPLFVRRNEGPFHGPGARSYAERMQLSPPKSTSAIASTSEQP